MGPLGINGLIVGSTALRHWFEDARLPRDLDIYTPHHYAGADTFWHPALAQWITPDTDRFASPDELYTIKLSHISCHHQTHSSTKHVEDAAYLERRGAHCDPLLHILLCDVWKDMDSA